MASPLALLGATLGAACFARGFRRLRTRRPEYAGWDRAALFGLAIGVSLFAMSSALDSRADDSLAAHMVEHVLIGDVVPALSLVALRGPLLFFVVPQFLLRSVARNPAARGVLSTLTRPLVAFALWAGSIAVWHVPSLYDATLTNEGLHVLEHGIFFVTGTLAWIQIVDPARRGSLSAVGRLGFVLGMFMTGQVLAMTFVATQAPVYSAYAQGERVFGLSPLSDQRYAASVMMGEQILLLGVAAVFLLRRHLEELAETAAAVESSAHPFTT